MPITDAPKRQHLSTSGEWVACYASVKPCPRTQHRDTFSFERETFFAEIDAQVARQPMIQPPLSETEKAQTLADVREQAEFFLRENEDLEIPNHSAEKYGEWVPLSLMADGAVARNNCWAVTGELLQHMGQHDFDGDTVDQIEIEGSGVYHAAIVTRVDGQHYVVDYTIRQFGQSLPFPYVDTQQSWIATVEQASGLALRFTGDEYADDEG